MTAPGQTAKRHVGDLIRRLRQAAGLTRRQLAAGVGLNESVLRNVESGRYLIRPSTLQALMKAPALADLPTLAGREGIELDLEVHSNGDQDGGSPGAEGK